MIQSITIVTEEFPIVISTNRITRKGKQKTFQVDVFGDTFIGHFQIIGKEFFTLTADGNWIPYTDLTPENNIWSIEIEQISEIARISLDSLKWQNYWK